MHIVHINLELASIAKVGGLADVVFGLTRETQKQEHMVEVLIPKYDFLNYILMSNLKPESRKLKSYDGLYCYHTIIWSATTN